MDEELLSKLKKGDIEAFEKVLLQYEKAIFGYILGMIAHRETAEDLTQETFMKLYKNLENINPDKSFKSWLYKIATNTVYDRLRSRKRNQELLIIDDEDNSFETIDETSTYLNIETSLDLEKALAGIKPIYRAVLTLFYYEGLGYNEIAAALSLPINTVKTHLRRAKEALKEQI